MPNASLPKNYPNNEFTQKFLKLREFIHKYLSVLKKCSVLATVDIDISNQGHATDVIIINVFDHDCHKSSS